MGWRGERGRKLAEAVANGFHVSHQSRCDGRCNEQHYVPFGVHRRFRLGGCEFDYTRPVCQATYFTTVELMGEIATWFQVTIVHRKELQRLIRKRVAIWDDYYELPFVYDSLPHVHRYYCLRDVVAMMPEPLQCDICGKRLRWPERGQQWCDGHCAQIHRTREAREWRHIRTRQELERLWLKKGADRLKKCREVLRKP